MLLTRKANSAAAPRGRLAGAVSAFTPGTIDRRGVLKRSGVAAGAGALAAQLPFSIVGKAEAATQAAGAATETKRTACATAIIRIRHKLPWTDLSIPPRIMHRIAV